MTMLKVKLVAIALFIFCTSAYGTDTKPSEKSIRELLRVTESHTLLDNLMAQFDNIMNSAMQQGLKGQSITPK